MEDKNISTVPHGRKLPFWDQPRSRREAIAKINNLTNEWAKTTEDFVYRAGKWFLWLKYKLPHGEFEQAVSETRFKIRTARNFMNYTIQCDSVSRILPYHPNPKAGAKPATVAVLESPENLADEEKQKRPKHEAGKSPEWNVTDAAAAVLQRFESVTANRTPEECDEVRLAFDEIAREHIEEKAESQRMIREGGRFINE